MRYSKKRRSYGKKRKSKSRRAKYQKINASRGGIRL